jgi:hypothetical protein
MGPEGWLIDVNDDFATRAEAEAAAEILRDECAYDPDIVIGIEEVEEDPVWADWG